MARKIIPLKRKNQEPKLSRAEQSQRANRTILRRTLVLMALFGVVVFIPLIVTLYNLMIRDHDYYEAQAIDNQTRYTSLICLTRADLRPEHERVRLVEDGGDGLY